MDQSKPKLVALLLGAAMLAAPAVQADPSPSARYLLTHQASAMDLGLFRLGSHHAQVGQSFLGQSGATGSIDADATYKWETNRISVLLTVPVQVPGGLTTSGAKAICREALIGARVIDGVMAGSAKPFDNAWTPDDYFVPDYVIATDRPGSIKSDVLSMIEFTVSVYDAKSPMGGGRARCQGRLLSSEVLYSQ